MACMDLHYGFPVHTAYMHIIYSGFFFLLLILFSFFSVSFSCRSEEVSFLPSERVLPTYYHSRNKNNPIHRNFPSL